MEPETGPKTTGSEAVEERREQGTKNKGGRCVRRCKTMVTNWLLELGGQAPGVGDYHGVFSEEGLHLSITR